MVSNDELRRELADKRLGKTQIKKSLTEDRTPSIEEIKEKLRQKRKIQSENRGYLFCKNCKGCYELQPGESAEDFGNCKCGGELKHLKTLDIIKDVLKTK